jgi:hypothetical protein
MSAINLNQVATNNQFAYPSVVSRSSDLFSVLRQLIKNNLLDKKNDVGAYVIEGFIVSHAGMKPNPNNAYNKTKHGMDYDITKIGLTTCQVYIPGISDHTLIPKKHIVKFKEYRKGKKQLIDKIASMANLSKKYNNRLFTAVIPLKDAQELVGKSAQFSFDAQDSITYMKTTTPNVPPSAFYNSKENCAKEKKKKGKGSHAKKRKTNNPTVDWKKIIIIPESDLETTISKTIHYYDPSVKNLYTKEIGKYVKIKNITDVNPQKYDYGGKYKSIDVSQTIFPGFPRSKLLKFMKKTKSEFLLKKEAAEGFIKMREAAQEKGIILYVNDALRSFKDAFILWYCFTFAKGDNCALKPKLKTKFSKKEFENWITKYWTNSDGVKKTTASYKTLLKLLAQNKIIKTKGKHIFLNIRNCPTCLQSEFPATNGRSKKSHLYGGAIDIQVGYKKNKGASPPYIGFGPTYEWLKANASNWGFEEEATEPWHYTWKRFK